MMEFSVHFPILRDKSGDFISRGIFIPALNTGEEMGVHSYKEKWG